VLCVLWLIRRILTVFVTRWLVTRSLWMSLTELGVSGARRVAVVDYVSESDYIGASVDCGDA
jgi:hypothetical protein